MAGVRVVKMVLEKWGTTYSNTTQYNIVQHCVKQDGVHFKHHAIHTQENRNILLSHAIAVMYRDERAATASQKNLGLNVFIIPLTASCSLPIRFHYSFFLLLIHSFKSPSHELSTSCHVGVVLCCFVLLCYVLFCFVCRVGKNYTFDKRFSHGAKESVCVSSCVVCLLPWDRYQAQKTCCK